MDKINELRSRTVALLQSTVNLTKEHGLEEKEKRLNHFVERLKRGRTVVVVCGEFKRGKSSFINALIEEPDLCPVDIDITTNMATQLQYSSKEYARVHFNKAAGKTPITIGKVDIPKYVTEQANKENKEEVQLVEIGIPKEKLYKNLMVIVDTPGVGSLNIKHSEVTAGYLSIADVLLFVCDATAPLTTAELEFIKRAGKYCTNIYYILTKIDMVRGWKSIEEENRKKLAQSLGKPEDGIKIFPVSSLNKLDYIKNGDEESLEDSKFKALEESLEKDLGSTIAKNILLAPLLLAKNDTMTIKKTFMLQYKTFQQGTVEKKKAIEEKLAEINEQYKTLQKSNSRWQMIFSDNCTEIRRKMRKVINDNFLLLEKDLKEKVKDENFRSSADTVNAYIKNNVFDIMRAGDDVLAEEIKEIQAKVAELLGKELNITLEDFSDLEISDVDSTVFKDQRSSGEKVRDLGRNVSMNAGVFTSIGGLTGGILFGLIGTVTGVGAIVAASWGASIGSSLGGVIGGIFGAKSHLKDLNKKQEIDTLRACLEVIRESKVNCLDIVDSSLTQILAQIKNDFYNIIQESMETVEKTKSEVNKSLSLSNSEINTKAQKLQEAVKLTSELESKIDNTIAEVQGL